MLAHAYVSKLPTHYVLYTFIAFFCSVLHKPTSRSFHPSFVFFRRLNINTAIDRLVNFTALQHSTRAVPIASGYAYMAHLTPMSIPMSTLCHGTTPQPAKKTKYQKANSKIKTYVQRTVVLGSLLCLSIYILCHSGTGTLLPQWLLTDAPPLRLNYFFPLSFIGHCRSCFIL